MAELPKITKIALNGVEYQIDVLGLDEKLQALETKITEMLANYVSKTDANGAFETIAAYDSSSQSLKLETTQFKPEGTVQGPPVGGGD